MSVPILLLLLLVWISYLYIATTYTRRTLKYVSMPVHLRWELYPVPHEGEHGSFMQKLEWWKKRPQKSMLKDLSFIVKDYLTFWQYFQRNRGYWSVLYTWHAGFYLIVFFHALVAIGALAMVGGIDITGASTNLGVRILYYLTLVAGVAGFSLGCLGSIGVLVKRLVDPDLRLFASGKNFFSYGFYFAVFASGLISWAGFDTTFAIYREFYHGVFTFNTHVHVDAALVTHAILFASFLFYMPSTQAMHYATKFFAYFAVRWNDEPNRRGGEIEEKLLSLLHQPVSWAAPHIQTGKTWVEVAVELPSPEEKGESK